MFRQVPILYCSSNARLSSCALCGFLNPSVPFVGFSCIIDDWPPGTHSIPSWATFLNSPSLSPTPHFTQPLDSPPISPARWTIQPTLILSPLTSSLSPPCPIQSQHPTTKSAPSLNSKHLLSKQAELICQKAILRRARTRVCVFNTGKRFCGDCRHL